MTGKGKFIFGLEKKIEICCLVLHAAGRIETSSLGALSKVANLNQKTLRSACCAGRVSSRVETALALACRFDANDPAWHDGDIAEHRKRDFDRGPRGVQNGYRGRDTAEEFGQLLRISWGFKSKSRLKLRGKISEDTDTNFALINIFDKANSLTDNKIHAFLQLDLKPGRSKDHAYAFGFDTIYLYLVSAADASFEYECPLGNSEPERLNGVIIQARGTFETPCWMIKSNNGIINGRYWFEKPIIILENAGDGDALDADIRAQLFDGSLILHGDETELSAAKQAIITRLLVKKNELSVCSDGWIQLAKQHLRIVSAETR